MFFIQIRQVSRKNYTIGCDIHDFIFTKANFHVKFMKFCAAKNSDYTVKISMPS